MRIVVLATLALIGIATALPVLERDPAPAPAPAWNGGVGDTHVAAHPPPTARDAEAWNPQPDPPGRQHGVRDAEPFNPQPDPPGRQHGVRAAAAEPFNPQPDPPGRAHGIVVGTLPPLVQLNPQPEPPGK
ncbi:uncharacterized protein LOC62_03G005132 [Vanrija pseudolonga]|uniref:Uncharacterized protein n=1 Tax=Vanrija pseudolonga TaxID=143232 RepID=A0AAF0YD09_9TREE|nr:hypothetical protein LOC62_03G005132 [Vanrija pseudolonga]